MSEEFNAVDAALLGFPPSLGNSQLLVQQRNVAALLHPRSPVERLLVDHNTGSGNSENYYQDGRPKIAIFPKECIQDDNHIVKVSFLNIIMLANVKFYPVRVADPLVRLLRQPDPVEAARNP